MSVRQFSRIKDLTGICVRFPDDDIEDFKAAQKALKYSTLNKLLSGLAVDGMECTKHDTFDVPPTELTKMARLSPSAMEKFQAILSRKPRTVPNEKSYTKWVSIPDSVSEKLATIARQLQWSEGQVVQQAIRSMLSLICDGSPGTYPEFFKLVRGYREVERRLKALSDDQAELELGRKQGGPERLRQDEPSAKPDGHIIGMSPEGLA